MDIRITWGLIEFDAQVILELIPVEISVQSLNIPASGVVERILNIGSGFQANAWLKPC